MKDKLKRIRGLGAVGYDRFFSTRIGVERVMDSETHETLKIQFLP